MEICKLVAQNVFTAMRTIFLILLTFVTFSFTSLCQTAVQSQGALVKLGLSRAVEIAIQNNLNVKSSEINFSNAQLALQ